MVEQCWRSEYVLVWRSTVQRDEEEGGGNGGFYNPGGGGNRKEEERGQSRCCAGCVPLAKLLNSQQAVATWYGSRESRACIVDHSHYSVLRDRTDRVSSQSCAVSLVI